MRKMDCNTAAFFALLRAGLWEKEVRLGLFNDVDFAVVYRIAEEQSVVGVVAAGMEHVTDVKIPKDDVLTFAGMALQLEQRNLAMNRFIEGLTKKMNSERIYSLLLKGQGIAQCYERPLWRSAGDVDLFLDSDNYQKAEALLKPKAQNIREENPYTIHKAMTISPWEVEIHGTLRSELGKRIDKELDVIQNEIFKEGRVRVWKNGDIDVNLPAANEDVVYVFTHILQHFFMGGIGLRQICDWCRLLWTYRESLNYGLLESRIRKMGLMSEWKAFGALAIDYLGFPRDSMPLLNVDVDLNANFKKKAERFLELVLDSGNFGHNKDKSYYSKYPYLLVKAISLFRNTKESMKHFMIFPMDATRVCFLRLGKGLRVAAKGK